MAEEYREKLLEAVAEGDDALMEKYLRRRRNHQRRNLEVACAKQTIAGTDGSGMLRRLPTAIRACSPCWIWWWSCCLPRWMFKPIEGTRCPEPRKPKRALRISTGLLQRWPSRLWQTPLSGSWRSSGFIPELSTQVPMSITPPRASGSAWAAF